MNFNDVLDPDVQYVRDLIDEESLDCNYIRPDQFDSKYNEINGLKLVCFNIRSLPRHHDEFSNFILPFIDADVIVLTETWLNSDICQLHEINNYNSYHNYRKNRIGGGVSIFVKDTIKSVQIENINVMEDFAEITGVKLNISETNTVTIIGCYRPPTGNFDRFLGCITDLFVNFELENDKCIITGDLNCCILREGEHNPTKNMIDLFHSYHFYALITKPTRISNNSYSVIDHIWSNILPGSKSGIFLSDISDHFPVFAIFPNLIHDENVTETINIKFRNYSQSNKNKFLNLLNQIDWVFLNTSDDVDNVFESYLEVIEECFNKAFPVLTKRIGYKRYCSPWLSSGLLVSIRNKHNLFKRFKQGLVDYQCYARYRNKLNGLIKIAKSNYYETLFTKNRSDLKKSWGIIKNLIHGRKARNSKLPSTYSTFSEVAQAFNSHFSTIGQRLQSNIEPGCDFSIFLPNIDYRTIGLYYTTENEVKDIIKELKNKNNGLILSASVLKCFSEQFKMPITILFNRMIDLESYPDILKLARVTPVFKSGNCDDLNNYRPISCLPILNTIIEKLLLKRLNNFASSQNIMSRRQFGFQTGMGTNDATLEFLSEVYNKLSDEAYFCSIFVDLKKAFDTVSHDLLLRKLNHYGFRGKCYNILKSYLTNRVQYTSCEGESSDKSRISVGVPQGSVLGPFLFLIFINDLSAILKFSKLILFADDTTMYSYHRNIDILFENLNEDLVTLNRWLSANKLVLNISKTNYMIFGDRDIPDHLKLSIDNNDLNQASEVTFLGLIIDKKLTFKGHISEIKTKLSKTLGIFRKLKFLPSTTLRNLYLSLVYPKFIYCIQSWGAASPTNLNKLIVMQKKFIRIISKTDYYAHTSPLFKNLNLLKLNDIFKYFTLIYMYKALNLNKYPSFLADLQSSI